jgi:tRNA 2-(methylsulfanyl)-N6-isopentenyladenosine37 hydroxylase
MTMVIQPTINILKSSTNGDWIDLALSDLDTVLLDHSHCERKAAGVAVNMMFRYPSYGKLVRELTKIAREELEHFELVNQILEERNIPMAPLDAPPYGATLKNQIRHKEPDRLLDSLLISGLIEARSHERLGILAEHLDDYKLATFYRSLMASEARHFGTYWMLANTYFDRETMSARLDELATIESDILATLHPQPRIHS